MGVAPGPEATAAGCTCHEVTSLGPSLVVAVSTARYVRGAEYMYHAALEAFPLDVLNPPRITGVGTSPGSVVTPPLCLTGPRLGTVKCTSHFFPCLSTGGSATVVVARTTGMMKHTGPGAFITAVLPLE